MKAAALIIITLLTVVNTHAKWRGIPAIRYHVIQDTIDSNVPKGTCLITGQVTFEGKALTQAIVGTIDNKNTVVTRSTGLFTIEVGLSDSVLYFFKPSYEEIITQKFEFKDQHHMIINFEVIKNPYPVQPDQIYSYKPVVYLYSDLPQNLNIGLNVRGETTFTYPEIKDGWKVNASASGKLTDASGRTYPYLFWEGTHPELEYTKNGEFLKNSYQIKTDSAIQFLESSLKEFGLNDTESADFITFWGPKLVAKDYALIQFIFDADYDKEIATIEVNPKPTASRRIYMKFTGLDDYDYQLRIQPAKTSSFQRTSFTLIEWGGTDLALPKDQL
jgi:hypothetical protein